MILLKRSARGMCGVCATEGLNLLVGNDQVENRGYDGASMMDWMTCHER